MFDDLFSDDYGLSWFNEPIENGDMMDNDTFDAIDNGDVTLVGSQWDYSDIPDYDENAARQEYQDWVSSGGSNFQDMLYPQNPAPVTDESGYWTNTEPSVLLPVTDDSGYWTNDEPSILLPNGQDDDDSTSDDDSWYLDGPGTGYKQGYPRQTQGNQSDSSGFISDFLKRLFPPKNNVGTLQGTQPATVPDAPQAITTSTTPVSTGLLGGPSTMIAGVPDTGLYIIGALIGYYLYTRG
jgi:hypothetical protein